MKYGKLINDQLIFAPRKVRYGGYIIYNPPEEVLLTLGYKPVQYTDPPDQPTGYHLVESWAEDEEKITQVWTVVPDEEVNEE